MWKRNGPRTTDDGRQTTKATDHSYVSPYASMVILIWSCFIFRFFKLVIRCRISDASGPWSVVRGRLDVSRDSDYSMLQLLEFGQTAQAWDRYRRNKQDPVAYHFCELHNGNVGRLIFRCFPHIQSLRHVLRDGHSLLQCDTYDHIRFHSHSHD